MKRPMHRKLLVIIGTIAAFVSAASGQPAPPGNKPDVTLGSTPDTVVWGYISSRTPPVLRIKSGTTVRIDTMSHQGLTTNADPVTYFGRAGIKPELRGPNFRARPRRAVVAVPRVDARLPERIDLRAVAGAEADVEPAGHRVLAVRRPDGPVLPLDQLGARMPGLDTQDAQHRAVEALGGREVRDGDADVVEHLAEATVRVSDLVQPGGRRRREEREGVGIFLAWQSRSN